MSNFYGQTTSDTSTRKKWDLDEYRERAAERELRDRQLSKDDERRRLGRQLNLDARVGKTQIAVSASVDDNEDGTPSAKSGGGQRQPGFYCEACDCTLKDSISYLDHINGKKHQISIGQIMGVERSTLEQVRARLAALKRKKAQPKKDYNLDEQIALQRQKKEDERQQKKLKQQEKKQKLEEERQTQEQQTIEEMGGVDTDMASMMGFAGFGTSKK
ncbi:hypothetical protein BDF19DRAFT_419448 [Syncephalis fuscata]|nr:hypothetical protein BDF19DRAFT_419448 [Syncephalis fuscata]